MGDREERLAAVRARLREVETQRILAPILDPAVLPEARRLEEVIQEDDLEARCELGWLHWYRFQALPEPHNRVDLDLAIELLVPCFLTQDGGLPEPLLPVLAGRAVPEAEDLMRYALDPAGAELLPDVIALWRRILAVLPADDANRPLHLHNLATGLRAGFTRSGFHADLDAAIEVGGEALAALPSNDRNRAMYLTGLGISLQARFKEHGERADLDTAVELFQEALDASPANPPLHLSSLALGLQARFDRYGEAADLDAAIEAGRAAVDLTAPGHRHRPMYLNNLGHGLRVRFERLRRQPDLDAAVEACWEAVDATPPGHPDRPLYLRNLGIGLRLRAVHTGASDDLDVAVDAFWTASDETPLGDPERSASLNGLGIALHARFRRTGALEELESSIDAFLDAVAASPGGHPDRPVYLGNLGNALRVRFEHTGSQDDLDHAIDVCQEAMATIAHDDPDRPAVQHNLGSGLHARFTRGGTPDDLDAAVESCQAAVVGTPEGHVDRPEFLSTLGIVTRTRHLRYGGQDDLDAAVAAFREAVDTTPAYHPDRPRHLNNLGVAQSTRHQRYGGQDDLDAAIAAFREAVDTTPAHHPDRPRHLNNLGLALQVTPPNATDDLDDAVGLCRQAVAATPVGHPERPKYLSALANALVARSDLDEAIDVWREAVAAAPEDHTDRGNWLAGLGLAAETRYELGADPTDLETALSAYEDAAALDSAAPSSRILWARAAARLATPSDPHRAAGLLADAVGLLPTVAPRRLERTDRQRGIGEFDGLASDAAASALADTTVPSDQRAEHALRLLETGRAVLLSQSLETRSDLTDLRDRHPDLAARFADLRDLLDQPAEPMAIASPPTGPAPDRRRLTSELTALLADIRVREGFASFGLLPPVEELLALAEAGPVVTFNVSPRRSDALLLTSTGISSLELPDLSHTGLVDRVITFRRALETAASPRSAVDRGAAAATLREILEWLWDVVVGPVLEALGHSGSPPDSTWPRVWWAPGGLLGLLPVHAAGHHARSALASHRTAMDRVVSSYTPTIRALRHARKRREARPDRSLIVAMPTTPGLPRGRLLGVPEEVALLQTRLPRPMLLTEPDGAAGRSSENVPTKAVVLAHLRDCTIAHFACHGYTDPGDPGRSLLLLHDHEAEPFNVASLAAVSLDHSRLAYLSACSTGLTKARGLLDESIHLVSAFQLAGFPHVIGTLWEIDDERAVTLADDFYRALVDGSGALDTSRAAHALHQAVRALRDELPRRPFLWAAHFHSGA